MFQPREETTPRTNNHMATKSDSVSIYIFGSSHDNQLQRNLLNTLDQHSYSYDLQTDLVQLKDLRINRTNQQRLIVILTNVYSDDEIKPSIQKNSSEQQSSQKVHIYTYPNKKTSLGLKNLSSLKELLSICEQLKRQKQKQKNIRLAGVHSIDKSYSSSKDITKIKTASHYQSIKYMRNNFYGLDQNDLYDKITDIFEKQNNMEPFVDLHSTIANCKEPKDQKVLFIVPSNLNQQAIKTIKKKSKDNFIDLMLIGPVNPNQYILSKNIVLATNSPRKVYQYLKEKNMISPHIVSFMFEELIRSGRYETQKRIEYQRSGQEGRGRGYNQQQAIVSDFFHKITEPAPATEERNEYQMGSDKKSEMKPKIKKIKSPAKSRPSQFKNNQNDISIRVSQPYDQPLKQTDDYHINKQGEKIRKSLEKKAAQPMSITSTPDIPFPPPAPVHHYPTAHQIRQYSNQQYPMKQSKYRHPSMIIHETSDEYRGSNKQSIMNIEADSKFNGQYNNSVQEAGDKKIITMGNGEPQAYYLRSDSTIRQGVKDQDNSRTTYNYKPSEQANNSHFNQGYQTQRQVFRKGQVIHPEEVIQESTTSIRDTPNFRPPERSVQNSGYSYQSTTNNPQYGETITGTRSSTYHPYTRLQNNTQNIYNLNSSSNNMPVDKTSKNQVNQGSFSYGRHVEVSHPSNPYKNSSSEGNKNTSQYTNIYTAGGSPATKYYSNYSFSNKPSDNANVSSSQGNNLKYVSTTNTNGHTNTNGNVYTSSYGYTSSQGNNNNLSNTSAVTRNATSPGVQAKYNLEGYERVEVNGITMYRKKQTANNQVNRDSSPKVQRYEVSPRREAQVIRKEFTSRPQYQAQNSSRAQNPTQRYVANSYYNSSPRFQREYYNSNSYQVGPITVTNQEKINTGYRAQISPEPTSKGQQQHLIGITYKSGGGQIKDKVDVQRYEYYEQRLQAPNIPSSRTLNDSNWMSKPSDLYSDGSILRKNNVRFGIKLKRKETSQASVIQSKLGSRIYTVKDLNKKMALTKKIEGEEQLQREEESYTHVNPGLTGFHYLIQEQLKYLECKLTPIFTYHDKIDYFSCIQDLVQKCQDALDCGFILATEQQRKKLNPNLLPEDYYLVRTVERSPFLELNETHKIIQMDNLSRLPLASKIVLDKKLFQYVVYQEGDKEVQSLAEKFNNSEFIVDKWEVEMTEQFIESYFEEYPQLTRLYLLCRPEYVPRVKEAVSNYKKMNSDFQIASLRIVCLSSTKQNRSKLQQTYPFLTFLRSWQQLSYQAIISQVHKIDKQSTLLIKPDRLYLHESQSQLMKDIERQFPNRFEFYMYKSGSELPRKMLKRKERGYSSYLVMYQSLVGEKISLQSYRRVFLMGRAKTIPNQVVRVIKNQELIELLKD